MSRFLKSIGYAVQGILNAARSERNLKVQLVIAMLVLLAGFYLGITSTEWCIILLTIALVLGMEMINTAIEKLVDLISPDRCTMAGKIKDVAAGAVLVVSILAAVIGVIIFKRYIL